MASVGMMEHVGRAHLDLYFASLVRHLAPGGLLLNHAIAETGSVLKTIPWLQRTHGGFIRQEIFPDSDLPALDLVIAAAQRAGFEVLDVEAFRPFYVRTLLEWLGRLERRFTEAVQLVGKRRARAWRLYFASTAVTFKTGRTTVAQVLLQKREGGSAAGPRQAALVPRARSARLTLRRGSGCGPRRDPASRRSQRSKSPSRSPGRISRKTPRSRRTWKSLPVRGPEHLHRLVRTARSAPRTASGRAHSTASRCRLLYSRHEGCAVVAAAASRGGSEGQPRNPRSSVAKRPTFGSTEARSPGATPNHRASAARWRDGAAAR